MQFSSDRPDVSPTMREHYATISNNPIRKRVFQKKMAINRWLWGC